MKFKWRKVSDIMYISILVVDLFCGAGGTTTGMEQAEVSGHKIARVIVCVNHDANAIRSHEANHPDTVHMTEDIRLQAMAPIAEVVQYWKGLCPWAKLVLWASLECTNHSNAKGGDSRDADSRSLAEHLDRYIVGLDPDYIWIENVREFRKWGPLLQKRNKVTGAPVFHRNRQTGEVVPTMVPDKTKWAIYFEKWKADTMALGYSYDDRDFNAANFDAPQNRIRYFGSFAKTGLKHVFPKPFTKKGRPVKDVLDFSDEGEGIFDPKRKKKITSPKTFDRIRAGVEKHVAPGRSAFVVKYTNYSNDKVNPGIGVDQVMPTVCARQHLAVANAKFLSKYFGGKHHHSLSIDSPAGTVTAVDHHALVDAKFLVQMNGNNLASRSFSTDEPARALTTTGGKQYLCNTDFLALYYSGGGQTSPIEAPSPALVTKDRIQKCKVFFLDNYYGQSKPTSIENTCGALSTNPHHYLVTAAWMDNRYGSGSHNHSSIQNPAGSVLANPKQVLMNAKFILNHNYDRKPTGINEPAPTILASRKHYYIVNPQFGYAGSSIENPCGTVLARQDKKPLSIATCDLEAVMTVIVRETQNPNAPAVHIFPMGTVVYNLPGGRLISEGTKKERDFYIAKRKLIEVMVSCGIIDIKMRMLKVVELLRIQGFPEDYKLIGTQSEQKKYIGNAVYTGIPKKWAEVAATEFTPWLKAAA